MTVLWTSDDAAAATGGTNSATWKAKGISIDTRTIEPGDLFVALKDQRDGHDFVAQAFEKGAAAALVSHRPKDVWADAPLLIVQDTLDGLEGMARAARARSLARIIAVTGSVGKTGTKEMLRSGLVGQGRVHASERSYNNHWGVPLTLARMPAATEFGVIEIGMNHPGEITPLSQLARPHVALITTVEKVHMAAFNTLRGIARAKAEIFAGAENGGTAILNRDITMYPLLHRAARKAGLRAVRFGYAGRPEFWLRAVHLHRGSTSVYLRHAGQRLAIRIPAPGRHLAMNAAGALAAIDAAGGDLARAALGLANWHPPEGRGTRLHIDLGEPELDGTLDLIDESYNANPASMAAALDVLAATETRDDVGRIARGRRVAILGDMLELGAEAEDLHAELATHPALDNIDRVHTVGPLMAHLSKALPLEKRGHHFNAAGDLAAEIRRLVDAGDVVMVKGSNGIGLSAAVRAIKNLGQVRKPGPTEAP